MTFNPSKEEKMLLDIALNMLPSINSDYDVTETMEILTGKGRDSLNELWDKLVNDGIVFKNNYRWSVDKTRIDEIKAIVEEYLKEVGVTPDRISSIINEETKKAEKLSIYVKLLGEIRKNNDLNVVTFVDGRKYPDVGSLCDDLVKKMMAFRHRWSSRNHYYEDFFIRTWPFNVEEIIRESVLKHLNVGGLKDEEWQIISLLLFSQYLQLEYEIIKNNMNISSPELREFITNLKERGLITEDYANITLYKGLKEPLMQYFIQNFYPKLRSEAISRIKQRFTKSLSAVWLFTTAEKIYDLPEGEIRNDPILLKVVNKSDAKEFEPYLKDIRELGVLYDFRTSLVLNGDILKEIGTWLKGSISQFFVFIPANDYYLARSTFKDIFSKCNDYVKIQDPYLGEETFDLLEYIPQELEIKILTSIKLGGGEEPKRIIDYIESFMSQRRGKFQIIFIGDKNTGEAPFHDRFILSKDSGWYVGTSLKQVGKGKETTISEIPKGMKNEMVEPAFDRWYNIKNSELQ
ncbi:MAG: hypothetical protein ACP5U0_10135, partial [Caldisphaera sp.]